MLSSAGLLHDIDAFLEAHRMTDSTFSRMAVNRSGFLARLRGGGGCTEAVAERVRGFIAGFDAAKNEARPAWNRPPPSDFAEFAATETTPELARRYHASTTTICRWRKEVGTPVREPGPPPNKAAIPDGFALTAQAMTMKELRRHYGRAGPTVQRWCREAGVTPRTATRAPSSASIGSARAQGAPVVRPHRDYTQAGQAADYLRKFGPVVRCNADGHYDPKGRYWRRGSTVLNAAEIVDRAVRNGWDADAWRKVA